MPMLLLLITIHLSRSVAFVRGQEFAVIEDLDYNETQITGDFDPRLDRSSNIHINSGSGGGGGDGNDNGNVDGVVSIDPPIFYREKAPPRPVADDHGRSESDDLITAHVTSDMDTAAGGPTVEVDCGAYEAEKLSIIFKRVNLAPHQGASFQIQPSDNEAAKPVESSSLECAFVWGSNLIHYVLYKNNRHHSEGPFSNWLLNEKGLYFKAPGLGFLLPSSFQTSSPSAQLPVSVRSDGCSGLWLLGSIECH
ncbi:hypothetical protein AXG93_3569s1000 [Marchantia polymorpha subsp. ruderalis]|uniref:Uncharacterized protein n=1 Tax=Marchantia polymorpha subsp. ruderalis TaxID=1480154 RepID=A0A176WJU7_MARPO|nr:hypothetical protein AXG93_3569s1000 [Marchantia polymorpha subsp. ruderalis]